MKETCYRVAFTILMVGVFLVLLENITRGQEQKDPPPPTFKTEIIGKLKVEPVKLDILPKITVNGRQTFRVRTTIEPNDQNVSYSLAGDCGYDAYGSQRGIEAITDTRYIDITVAETCIFVACVYRREKEKVRDYCVTAKVTTIQFQPP